MTTDTTLTKQAQELLQTSQAQEPSAEMADTLWALMHEYQKRELHLSSGAGYGLHQRLRQEWMRHRY